MKRFAVIPNPKKDKDLKITKKVVDTLLSSGGTVYVDQGFSGSIGGVSYVDDFPKDTELIIVVGGDGSMLDASIKAIKLDVPLVGVNLGKVGYLSEVEPDNVEILNSVFNDDFKISEKILLATTLISGENKTVATRLGVNDIVISHDSFLGIAEFTVGSFEGGIKYRADGLIISTPAGSTAYSLSAGGPIVSHGINAIVVTPVCPHSFFDRSIIFSPQDIIKVTNNGTEKLNVSIDGRYFSALLPGEECVVETSEKKVKVLTFKENNMFSTLFKKMRILEDVK